MGIKEELQKGLKVLKPVWLAFIDTLVTGECACHFPVKMTFESAVTIKCDDEGDRLSIFGPQGTCSESVNQTTQTIDMPVFFANAKFPSGFSTYIPKGCIRILTTLENIEKLQQSKSIEVCGESYIQAGERQPCGWDKEFTFYAMDFNKCV